MKTTYADAPPFITKDRSVIRELMHPARHAPSTMSFAEAIIHSGGTTLMHFHHASEEIYHVTQGAGTMRLGTTEFDIHAGDTIMISPGTRHNVTNTAEEPLKILCVCHPPYSDEDTALL